MLRADQFRPRLDRCPPDDRLLRPELRDDEPLDRDRAPDERELAPEDRELAPDDLERAPELRLLGWLRGAALDERERVVGALDRVLPRGTVTWRCDVVGAARVEPLRTVVVDRLVSGAVARPRVE